MRPLWVLLSIAWLGDGVCYLRAAAQGASSSAADAGDFRGGMGCPCIEVDHAALSAQYPKSNIEVDEEAGCLRAPRSAEGVGATRTYVGWPPQFRALPSKAVKQHSLTPACSDMQVVFPSHVRLQRVPCVGRHRQRVLRRRGGRGPLHREPNLRIRMVFCQRHPVQEELHSILAQSPVRRGGPLLFVRHVHRARRHHPAGLAVPALRELAAAGRKTAAHRRAVHGRALLLQAG
jgi:hypothetical protein